MRTVSPPDTWVYALRLPHDPRAARVARMTVRSVLDSHGRPEVRDTVELLTSELVTNTYLHTKGPASLRLTSLMRRAFAGRCLGPSSRHSRTLRQAARGPGPRRPGGFRGRARPAPRAGVRRLLGRLDPRRRPAGSRGWEAVVVRGGRVRALALSPRTPPPPASPAAP